MSEFIIRPPEKFGREKLRGDPDFLKEAIINHLNFTLGKDKFSATKRDLYHALAYTIRDQMVGRWIKTQQQYYEQDTKRVYYLSLEFLIGRTLQNSLLNLGLYDNCKKAIHDLGFDLDMLIELETDAGLGNGGLGRLAACFLDSMATLNIPGYGYGIRYDYGIFTQVIQNGYQIEKPENWLRYGNPWEICRTEYLYPIRFYGRVAHYTDERGRTRSEWVDSEEVMAMAYDTPVPGFSNDTVNTLRLWQAKSHRGFDLSYFNHGDYIRAVEDVARTENISRVLYPSDNKFEGKELRLKQEYFLVSATLQDIVRRYNKCHIHLDALADKVAIQLNDTHPALAIAEMMHILVDREELSWEKSWELTRATFSYTNHTILPEALERWPVPLMEKVLPRHMEIIFEINRRWLEQVARIYPNNVDKLRHLSIIEEGNPKRVNMANLAIVGSSHVNGVSKLHSELLTTHVFRDYWQMNPEKFINVTNGVTPRRWLNASNPPLASLIDHHIGNGWIHDLTQLEKLGRLATDAEFKEAFAKVKRENKERLAKLIYAEHEISVPIDSIFDVQIKRMHEYKRQLLNAFHVIYLYNQLRSNPQLVRAPRTVIFSGKAAPGYFMAKLIIKLITSIADKINQDPDIHDRLKVVFLENYRVSLAEKLIPAADLSEQISTAGTEASGTGNMKLALNGALTICTLDGANIEMLDQVGKDGFFVFGLTAEQIEKLHAGGYRPWEIYQNNAALKQVIDSIRDGFFSNGDKQLFGPLVDSILSHDTFSLLADFDSYIQAQSRVDETYRNRDEWLRRSIWTVAHMGKFSSDRAIQEYAEHIWKLK